MMTHGKGNGDKPVTDVYIQPTLVPISWWYKNLGHLLLLAILVFTPLILLKLKLHINHVTMISSRDNDVIVSNSHSPAVSLDVLSVVMISNNGIFSTGEK